MGTQLFHISYFIVIIVVSAISTYVPICISIFLKQLHINDDTLAETYKYTRKTKFQPLLQSEFAHKKQCELTITSFR